MKNKKRTFLEFAAVLLACVLIEVIIFNFPAVRNTLSGREKVSYGMERLSFQNWHEQDGRLVSESDPMILKDNLGVKATSFTVKLNAEPMPDSLLIFYTTGVNENFSADKMLVIEPATGDDTVQLDERISAIRVDPGETEGIVLKDVSFVFNEVGWDISAARIIAMLIIYWGTKFLMSLQKNPDYGEM